MKKLTLLVVMAVLCPFLSKEKGTKSKDDITNNKERVAKYIVTLLLIIFYGFAALAQEPQTISPLKVGDKVPESFWSAKMQILVDGKTQEQTLSVYKGKAIILDFWGIYCVPCINAFPQLGAWQKKFNSSLQIIGVTKESKENLDIFFAQRDQLGFPSVIADNYLNILFKHVYIPHEVWINQEGIVVGFSSAEKVSDKSIANFIATGQLNTEMKIDQDLTKPLFASAQLPIQHLLNYSVLLKGHLEGTGSSNRTIDLPGVYGITWTNQTLISLVERIAGKFIPYYNSKLLLLATVDSAELFPPSSKGMERKEWYQTNEYSMSITINKKDTVSLKEQMLQMFNNYSGYVLKPIVRKMPCLVLRVKNDLAMRTTGGNMKNTLAEAKGKRLENGRISDLVAYLNSEKNGLPVVVNETAWQKGIDVNLDGLTIEKLQRSLFLVGLELVKAERELKVMVLTKLTKQ